VEVTKLRRIWQNNSLSIVSFGLFFLFWAGMAIAGYFEYLEQQQDFGQPATLPFLAYLGTGHFWEATFENWESEYLQMGLFVLLTAFLFQRGSAESKSKEEHRQEEEEEAEEEQTGKAPGEDGQAPWPIRRGGIIRTLYEYSLTIVLLFFFLASWILHALSGAIEYSQQQVLLGKAPATVWQFIRRSSGSSRCRTGRANSSPSARWWC